MRLVRLTYASLVTEDFTQKDLKKIISQSRENNLEKGITGYLLYDDKYFLQTVEGSAEEVNKLYNNIVNDLRHNQVQLLGFEEIEYREFTHWNLGYHTSTDINDEILLKYSNHKKFNPYHLHQKSSVMLLKEISQNIESE
ncbi:MAG: BLUF domain-containing protein [Bdellovibrionales bacterium]|nr:BLUF domain-containing protein [Bdellovibrionales bacterium]